MWQCCMHATFSKPQRVTEWCRLWDGGHQELLHSRKAKLSGWRWTLHRWIESSDHDTEGLYVWESAGLLGLLEALVNIQGPVQRGEGGPRSHHRELCQCACSLSLWPFYHECGTGHLPGWTIQLVIHIGGWELHGHNLCLQEWPDRLPSRSPFHKYITFDVLWIVSGSYRPAAYTAIFKLP